MDGNNYSTLLAPGRVGALALRNHMVMPPMATNLGTTDGYVTQRSIDFYEARSIGGVALIIVEGACVDFPRGAGSSHQLAIDHDRFLPGLGELAAAIKAHGAVAFLQLAHTGREAHHSGFDFQPVAPSAIRSNNTRIKNPIELSRNEIEELVGRFVDAAERAHKAGFDGVEIHGAHSYLFGQFLSRLSNARTDDYGGSLENRARMLVEIVQGIRRRLDPAFGLGVRLNGDDYAEGGIRIDEACAVAQMLEGAGVDEVHVSAGGHMSREPHTTAPFYYPNGNLLHLSEQMKRQVGVPVIGVGRLNTPALAEAALREGKCDLVALGRALIVDPEFPKKIAEGHTDEIRPCHACLTCLHVMELDDAAVVCATNPAAGRERELALQPAKERKRVFVIGGGVAGMEAARVAALRGHEVTLFEQDDRLGGQLIVAAVPPHKGEMSLLRDYYLTQMVKSGVQMRLGEAVEASAIVVAAPDAVIVATGKRPLVPPLPGIDSPRVVLAEQVLLGEVAPGGRVVIVGGGSVGCETADYLASRGLNQITVVEMLGKLAVDVLPMVRRLLLKRLAAAGVQMLSLTRAEAVDAEGLVVSGEDGERRVLPADQIVLATGGRTNNRLAEAIGDKVPEQRVVGDAASPRRLLEAIREGMSAGLQV